MARSFAIRPSSEVYPEIRDVNLEGVKIERPVARIEDEDIARTLETIRRQRTRWNAVTRAARNEDRLRIDFIGRLGGEAFEGGAGEGFPVGTG